MKIRIFSLGPFQTNGYLLSDGDQGVFIDPGAGSPELLELLVRERITLNKILITHMHSDHFYGAAGLARETGAAVFACDEDSFMIETEIREAVQWGYPPLLDSFSYTPIHPGEQEILGRYCKVLTTPGHTRGGVTYYFRDDGIAFVGDLIFKRSIGRTDFTGGDHDTLIRSIKTEILTLPDATILYSGHGPATTVGEERVHNSYLKL